MGAGSIVEMMEESKSTRTPRVAFALLCGLAVCCSVMYITSDGAEEFAMEDAEHHVGSGQDVFTPRSVQSTDVMKTGLLYTKTPDTIKNGPEGRERLLCFLDKIEANIAKEVEERKADITAIRAQMAKNMQFNMEARKKMKSMLLAKMAVNAKKAKDDLAAAMRKTQSQFAAAASLENKRMKKNKKEAGKQLKMATANQQRALATLASATNARIKQTNKHIAENAAQIKENAKKAREDLDNAMGAFNAKMANVQEEAKKGRSKLAAQAAEQDKKFRTCANNRIKAITAKTAKQFHDVRTKMADDSAHADASLAHTTSRMNAALSAQTALQDKRFEQTVADIAEAKKEANDRVDGFKTSFKADILKLSSSAAEQTKKLNGRICQLGAVVQSNKLEQAKVNNNVNAELKRMIKVGNDRYAEHLKKDAELKALMQKNKEETEKNMTDMASKFYASIEAIKEQAAKDRAHAENSLATATTGLYKTLADNELAQAAVNKELTEATRRAKLDAEAALRDAKSEFAKKTSALHQTVTEMEKKHNSKIQKLTGIVAENAIKDANGRAELRKISESNKAELNCAVHDAVAKGEARALAIEKKMTAINKKTREAMNSRITSEISDLRKNIHSQITELSLQTKAARAEMKAEIIYSIKTAKELAAQNLKNAVEWAEGEFTKLHTNLEAEEEKSGEERAALKAQIDADKVAALTTLDEAILNQNKALLAYRNEMCSEVGIMGGVLKNGEAVESECEVEGRLNTKLATNYDKMIANAKLVDEEMKVNVEALAGSLQAAKDEADAELAKANTASVARYNEVIDAVTAGIEDGRKKAEAQFVTVYETMGNAALEDARFSKTVKDIAAARAAATTAVGEATRLMKAEILETEDTLKHVENKVISQIQDVSAMIVSDKAAQLKINKQVNSELDRLLKKSDSDFSVSKRARGKLKAILDENKRIAHDEVTELFESTRETLHKEHEEQNGHLIGFKCDLTAATEKVYNKLSADKTAQANIIASMTESLDTAAAATAAELQDAKDLFASRELTLANAITENYEWYKGKMEDKIGLIMDWKEAADSDRDAIRCVRNAMVKDLEAGIERAISIGEAKAKGVQERAIENIDTEKKTLLTTISVAVENMADNIFGTVQGNRQKIADSYLSLKAYATAAADEIADYVTKGKGRGLSSIGDLLETLAEDVGDAPKPCSGMGFGADHIEAIFSGEEIPVTDSVSKVNGLVNEYISQLKQVKDRWPMGLGHYLLAKPERSMQGPGALEVDKISGKNGNFVFVNAHSVGLSSKLGAFERLAVSMRIYEDVLSKLTGSVSNKPIA